MGDGIPNIGKDEPSQEKPDLENQKSSSNTVNKGDIRGIEKEIMRKDTEPALGIVEESKINELFDNQEKLSSIKTTTIG